tara:strand:+ start:975 stop:1718 length:744 start_codon:yes stop_codon:yes gene_type:complete
MFKRNQKKPTLTFWCKETPIWAETFSPKVKLYPDWWRGLKEPKTPHGHGPASMHDIMPTMKTCPGFVDLLKTAIAVPMWKEMKIEYDTELKKIDVAGVIDQNEFSQYVESHASIQYGDYFANSLHLKLKTPWMVTCNSDIEFLMMDAVWHRKNHYNYTVLNGKLEFKYQHGSHVNIFIPKSRSTKTLHIDAGIPICYLLPLTEREIDIKIETVSHEKWMQFVQPPSWFRGHYEKMKKLGRYTNGSSG